MKKFFIIVMLTAFVCSGCSMNFKEARDFVDTYIEEFVEGNYRSMYAMLDSKLQSEITYEDFEWYHKELINSWGNIKGFEGPDVKVNFYTPRPIMYVYKIQFEHEWGAYLLTLSRLSGETSITFIDFISQKRAEEITRELLNKLPDTGVLGVVKNKTKTMLQESIQVKN